MKSCEECQRKAKLTYDEKLHPTWSAMVFDKVGVDVVYMPRSAEESFLVLARDDLSE